MRHFLLSLAIVLFLLPHHVQATDVDTDSDGLLDEVEQTIYHSNPNNSDTDNDGFTDGLEVQFAFDPNNRFNDRLEKLITVEIKSQTLTYSLGPYTIRQFKISSARKGYVTPKGEYSILVKKPVVNYRGENYYHPNTRWNMLFHRGKKAGFYIHGAYWHNRFGTPMSHGCINVPYSEMENLYNWADAGTKVQIN
jgi:lipoprotein-anchoring transpeptidase ErfK/SrfK